MFITSINRKSRFRVQGSEFRVQSSGFRAWAAVFLCLFLFSGCGVKNDLGRAHSYLKQSETDYLKAIKIYQELISRGSHLDKLHFELGSLHYRYGEFQQAIEELKKSELESARRLLAIAYYRNGNFTDALEVFNKNEINEAEYSYYYGLTCEKLNLFDKALGVYKKISDAKFSAKAAGRINIIEKQAKQGDINDIDPKAARIIAASGSREDYPQAGALILLCEEEIEVSRENTQIITLHYIVKILNERGKEDFSETKIGYDSTYEKVELEYARTIRADGKVVEVGSRHIRDVSKYLNFPLYSNARVYIISFPEIAQGSVIEYKLKIKRSRLINKKDFSLRYPLQTSEPVIKADFRLSLPAERNVYFLKLNEEYNNFQALLEPQVKEEAEKKIYSWQFSNIPQIMPEANMPPNAEINPTMLISTFSSWQEVYQWWQGLVKDKIKADADIKNKVVELIKGLDSDLDKAKAIYNFCAQEIRYVAVSYGDAGYEPHSAQDVFRNKYGDCKDQAVLLVTMFREAGLLAWPVLIPTRGYYNLNQDFPAMLFNHAIAVAQIEGEMVFLDPTAETCPLGDLPLGDQGRKVMIIKEDGYLIRETPLYAWQHNLHRQSLDIKVKSDEAITARRQVFTYGFYDQAQRHWLLYTPPELIEERLKERIQDICIGAQLEGHEIKNLNNLNAPVELDYSFSGKEYFISAGNLRILPQLAFLDASLVARDSRRYPIDFRALESKETLFEISLPDNFRLKYIPPGIAKDTAWFDFTLEYKVQGNAISLRQNMRLKKLMVLQKEYAEFKRIFEDLAKELKQRLILEKIK